VTPRELLLSRYPVASIISLTIGDQVEDTADLTFDPDAGIVYGRRLGTAGDRTQLTYVAGYVLPGEEGANLPAEIATLWIEDGTALDLIDLQRREVRARQALVTEILGAHIAHTHPLSLCAWLKVPPRWTEEGLVRMLAQKNIAVTPSDPFMAGDATTGGIRICIGGRLSRATLQRSLQIIAETFEQLPPVFDTSSIA